MTNLYESLYAELKELKEYNVELKAELDSTGYQLEQAEEALREERKLYRITAGEKVPLKNEINELRDALKGEHRRVEIENQLTEARIQRIHELEQENKALRERTDYLLDSRNRFIDRVADLTHENRSLKERGPLIEAIREEVLEEAIKQLKELKDTQITELRF